MSEKNNLYFDIETTGLSPLSSHITVIGTLFIDDKKPILRQFICEKPTDEIKILREFSEYATGFDTLVHYNGNTFDIPYLRKKCSFFRLSDPFSDLAQEDLFRIVKHFSSLIEKDSFKQKEVECCFGFKRNDPLSGADCVSSYQDYLRTGNKDCLEKILLHNKEDLLGMVHIRTFLDGFRGMEEGDFEIVGILGGESSFGSANNKAVESSCESTLVADGCSSFKSAVVPNGDSLAIQLHLDRPFFKMFERKMTAPTGNNLFWFSAEKNSGTLTLTGTYCEMKYFFDDYKNYFFLPMEGRAIHKSVGQFVDPAFRKQATRDTAYEPVTAVFYPQCSPVILPAFKTCAKDKLSFFRVEDIHSSDELKKIIQEAFHMFHKK